jgi:hypothetical protein
MNWIDRILFGKIDLKESLLRWLGVETLKSDSAAHAYSIKQFEVDIDHLEFSRDAILIENKKLKTRIESLEEFVQDVMQIGVDVHFKSPHMILIYTRLGGGQIREIEAYFEDLADLNRFCSSLKKSFRTNQITFDLPQGMPIQFFEEPK